MTARRACPPAAAPLEVYAARFDPLFLSLAQRRSFRDYLTGLRLPRDRAKTLTALAGAEPLVQAQAPAVQRLQFFLSESTWDAEAINQQRVALLCEHPATAPPPGGVLVLDDTGDRKDGPAMAHVARQYLGSVGKIDQGIVAVTTLWTDGRSYWPVHVEPYTPAACLPEGKRDPGFRTKPQIALALIERAQALGVPFRAVIADCFYGDHDGLVGTLSDRGIPYVVARRGRVGLGWAPAAAAHSFEDAARDLPGSAWHPVTRRFTDSHTETWWTAELALFGYGPQPPKRAIVATTHPATLPPLTTWYLTTNVSGAEASLADLVALYGWRNWVEDSYKRLKGELGWADFMVRSDRAIRRHWTLVCCAFSFCWPPQVQPQEAPTADASGSRATGVSAAPCATDGTRKKNRRPGPSTYLLAGGTAGGARVVNSLAMALSVLVRLDSRAPAPGIPSPAERRSQRPRHPPLSPGITNYR
jgi:SRSO17 transposase